MSVLRGDGFVVEVPVGEVASRFGEGHEVGELFDGGDAGKFFAEVVFVTAAVFRGVEESVNVIK